MQNIKIDDLRNENIEDNKHKILEIKLILDNPNIKNGTDIFLACRFY